MNIAQYRQDLLKSDELVISELKKVQVLYELKKVIRYDHTREQEDHTESDAEHIFGIHCLIDYFLPLEDIESKWNCDKIRTMAQYHDIDEIETGDEIGYRKTEADHANERTAAETVIKKLPETMQVFVGEALDEYKAMQTPEAKFVKALDKIEPVFHLYNHTGKNTLAELKTTKEQHDRVKYPHVNDFPIIKRFADVMTTQFEREGFYHKET